MKNKHPLILILSALAISVGYVAISSRPIAPANAEGGPATVVERFFDGATKDRSELVRSQPATFLDCLWKTVEECRSERAANVAQKTDQKSDDLSVIDLKPNPHISAMVESYMKKAEAGDSALVRVILVNIVDDEARVRIEIDLTTERLVRDILLFKENDWRIFEISKPDEYPNFVPVPKPAAGS